MPRKIEPQPNWVLVKLIGDLEDPGPAFGEVIAINPCGRRLKSGECRPVDTFTEGDTIIFAKYGGLEVCYNNETFILLNVRDILARLV